MNFLIFGELCIVKLVGCAGIQSKKTFDSAFALELDCRTVGTGVVGAKILAEISQTLPVKGFTPLCAPRNSRPSYGT